MCMTASTQPQAINVWIATITLDLQGSIDDAFATGKDGAEGRSRSYPLRGFDLESRNANGPENWMSFSV